jgi:hypothetical protein
VVAQTPLSTSVNHSSSLGKLHVEDSIVRNCKDEINQKTIENEELKEQNHKIQI